MFIMLKALALQLRLASKLWSVWNPVLVQYLSGKRIIARYDQKLLPAMAHVADDSQPQQCNLDNRLRSIHAVCNTKFGWKRFVVRNLEVNSGFWAPVSLIICSNSLRYHYIDKLKIIRCNFWRYYQNLIRFALNWEKAVLTFFVLRKPYSMMAILVQWSEMLLSMFFGIPEFL